MTARWGFLIALLGVAALCDASGEPANSTLATPNWEVATAYPADTVTGRAAVEFAQLLNDSKYSPAHFTPRFADRSVSKHAFQAVPNAPFRLLFSGDLGREEAILGVSVQPYQANSVEGAFELNCRAKPAYRSALAHHGLILLAVVPWPPTGIWSRSRLSTSADLSKMRVRAYDPSSMHILEALGARVVSLPIQEALDQIRGGQVDAVMSSGDGAAGRAYAGHLKHFTALRYTYPVSFLVADKAFFDALPDKQRTAIVAAGARTEQHAWDTLPGRIEQNYAQMKAAGVVVQDPAPTSVVGAIQRVAADSVGANFEVAEFLSDFRSCATCSADSLSTSLSQEQ
ncbi:TRAP transporter substrate-binding protein DctP (plasmid) [Burkholderia cenocepacia]|uniref:TRAP transporter substrate-binding protein DctP n=1 Tax=Burkholderia cenocepacia TaxID=95486 RepID=UPI0020A12E1C|nr:TRAP transporter substrate-binding protein DctP [Burkholderia cenocepacia]MCO8402793.1 TRAP transporter substrate-binding protein DctP [Burkholderia cenocepacia]MCO8415032.1 TRAP transporter substrate-binding protein DctP [Burkholderia cenocepacia]MCO8423072.1 TRAP transporter substrate-binding protein DctP [Burkholderia cenocepacia]MCO8474779.1 TRAP transporter substrate-binding protein DctP [Burkholderia cenocepacia]MCO8482041.1 TRAP transporter substrate-binding protein DctP [Burkholderi